MGHFNGDFLVNIEITVWLSVLLEDTPHVYPNCVDTSFIDLAISTRQLRQVKEGLPLDEN